MCRPFVHIHNHTEYSLLDGANRIPDLVKRAAELEMPSLAISDHGVMFGVLEFYKECRKRHIKPIVGMEAYVAPNGLHVKTGREENQTYHLLLLAKDLQGYRNLCKLHTTAALQGFYYKPRIDHELLRQHAQGLIGTSACLGSEICKALVKGRYDEAQRIAGMYKEMFDEGSFFIELQDHRLPDQAAIREPLIRIARELKLPLVATNDAHYLCRESQPAHDVLLCIGTGALVADENRKLKFNHEYYLKSAEEMFELFSDVPESLENTLRVAEMCNVQFPDNSRALMPDPETPPGMGVREYLEKLAVDGLRERVANPDAAAEERLRYELGVISQTKFESYFLLVREFAQYTRQQGIAFGVRGSAAGSLVSYCIGITDVNPLEYDLTFERFLNPERVSMPDIDMDFEDERRDEVIRWVTERYGTERVAQIVTFGTLGAKAAIKDSGRVMGYSPQETDRICKTIPPTPGITIQTALEESAEFRTMVENEPRVRELVQVARQIEGTARHAGVHAAGIVVSRDPLSDHIPLYRGNDGQPVTAFEMGYLEEAGLLKMDFLGLSNLTVLARAVQNVEASTGQKLDWRKLPLDDEKTYRMLGRGETVGVFQLESGGMRRNIVDLKPQNVRELAAMVALYRPGPMQHITAYIDSKYGRRPISYLDEKMRPILEETFGVIVYQDQVLKLVQALAGFSLGKADILRKAMGKKNKRVMDSMRVEFMEGAAANGVTEEVAAQVWELLVPFARYAFNKAHAVCYAIIAYQTAYLKANYPVEYMAALLAVYRSKEDRVTSFIEECRRNGIVVLPPDVNRSLADFSIEQSASGQKSIRFGLVAIKGVGEGLVEAIIRERGGLPGSPTYRPFAHLFEFCERTKAFGLNRTSLDALIKAGALDSLDRNRRKLLNVVDGALSFADHALRDKLSGQESLFGEGLAGPEPSANRYPVLPDCDPLTRTELLAHEKEVMGIYVSDHPLRGLEGAIRQASTYTCSSIAELEDGAVVTLAGVIASVRTITTRAKGERMATFVLEDFSGQASVTAFPATYAKFRELVQKDAVVQMRGVVSHRERPGATDRQVEVRLDDVGLLDAQPDLEFLEGEQEAGIVVIHLRKATRKQLVELRQLIESMSGDYRVQLKFGENGSAPLELRSRVDVGGDLIRSIRACVDSCDIEVRENPYRAFPAKDPVVDDADLVGAM